MELAINREKQIAPWVENFWSRVFELSDDLTVAQMGMVSKFFRELIARDAVWRPRFEAKDVTPPEKGLKAAYFTLSRKVCDRRIASLGFEPSLFGGMHLFAVEKEVRGPVDEERDRERDHRLLAMAILLGRTEEGLGPIVQEAPVVAVKHVELAVMVEQPDDILHALLKRVPPEADLSRPFGRALRSEGHRYGDWLLCEMAKRVRSVSLADLEYALRGGREDRTVECLLPKVDWLRCKTLVYAVLGQRSKQCVEGIRKRLSVWELSHLGLAVRKRVKKQVWISLYDQLSTIGATSTFYAVLRGRNPRTLESLVYRNMGKVYAALEDMADKKGYSKELVEVLCENRPGNSVVK